MPVGYEEENYSYGFNIDGVEIEQTLSQSFDPFSALDIDISTFQNTNQGLLDSNRDGRIPLGCFVFDDDNKLQNNFPDIFRDEKFTPIRKRNFIKNGSGQGIQSKYTKIKYMTDSNPTLENSYNVTPYLPLGNWSYCTYDALLDENKVRDNDLYVNNNLPQNRFEDYDIGQSMLLSFEQTDFTAQEKFNNNRQPDNNNTTGSSGWFAYFFDNNNSLARPQVHLDMIKRGFRNALLLTDGPGQLGTGRNYENQTRDVLYTDEDDTTVAYPNTNDADEFFHRINLDSDNRGSTFNGYNIVPTVGTPTNWSSNSPSRVVLPNIAKWIITDEAYSYGKCLEFLATDYINSQYVFTDLKVNTSGFTWDGNDILNKTGAIHNQCRLLNQVIEIKDVDNFNKHTIITIKFKMKTDSRFYNGGALPAVETSLHNSDSNLNEPMRTHDRINANKQYGYYPIHGWWPKGEFNSQRYNDDLNSPNTVNKKFSSFGSMGRFQNTVLDEWEEFEYTFSLGRWYHYSNSANNQHMFFMIQAAGTFLGRVLIDDIEMFESFDFTPDVNVVKKISAGNYGTADLTKYYDKELQPEQYKDSQAPLTAQFYFYPTYKTDKIFDVSRTPMYRDFKKGLFYIYDVNWGDGSSNEFVDKPVQISEQQAPCHLYTTNGIFEVTGTMIRMKPNDTGEKPIAIACAKKFKVTINVNEGFADDFQYFGSDGFSFLPYRNTLPIIGGHSKQSSYYKTIKRQLGFIDGGSKISIPFRYDGDKLKTELALVKMENQSNNDLELLPNYTTQRTDENNNVIYNGILPIREELGNGIGDCDLTNIKYYNEPKSLYELLGFEDEEMDRPNNPRYWKNIIPKDYSIFNREGLDGEIIDTYSEQEWLDGYYYPVLPKYDQSGRFIEDDFPNDKIPFPLEAPITDENDSDKSLLIHIMNESLDTNIIKDISGNDNLGFAIMDYRPIFNVKTLSPEKVKKIKMLKVSTNNGAF